MSKLYEDFLTMPDPSDIPHSTLEESYEAKELFTFDKLTWNTEELNGSFVINVSREDGGTYFDDLDNVILTANFKMDNLKFKQVSNKRINDIYELSASCLTKDTSSSSPSMLLHQFSTLMVVEMLDGKFKFEENMGSYQPDLIWFNGPKRILIDIGSSNTIDKLKLISKRSTRSEILTVNKYAFIPRIREFEWLKKMSTDCDTGSNSVMYDIIKDQSEFCGEKMFYTKELLDYFSGSNNLIEDSNMVEEIIKNRLKEDPSMNYSRMEELLIELSDLLLTEAAKIDLDNYTIREHYCFPDSESLSHLASSIMEQFSEASYMSEIIPTVLSVDENGRGDIGSDELKDQKPFYAYKLDKVRVHPKAYESYAEYPKERLQNKLFNREVTNAYLKRFKTLAKTIRYIKSRVDPKFLGPIEKMVTNKEFSELTPYESSKFLVSEDEPILLKFSIDIDPDHMVLLKSFDLRIKTIKFISRNRDYFESRFKRRIVSAIKNVYKDGDKLKVFHWLDDNIYAEVLISGMLFSDDKGVAYVSYFIGNSMYRTEKWRLSDLENNETSTERMISLCVSTKHLENEKYYHNYLILAFRLINENSWGASRWLKPYRYVASGLCMKSPLSVKALKKTIKEIREEDRSRFSFIYLFTFMKDTIEKDRLTWGRTPAFRFSFTDIGYECFLYDLCPKKTYGRKRHLKETTLDLIDEITLFNRQKQPISEIYSDFMRVTRLTEDKRAIGFRNHIDMLEHLSKVTDGRFTFSPISILIIRKSFLKLCYNPKRLQGSVQSLSSLCTARSSHDSISGLSTSAADSLNSLSTAFSTNSTSRLAIKLLNSRVDLTMRIFDKPQVGGNREISILTSSFRILQNITEQYAKKISEASSIDLLDRQNKLTVLSDAFTEAFNTKRRIMLTADQTRWGPNFTTVCFGLMLLLTKQVTTEYYIPTLFCLLSEFKAFEMPSWIPELLKYSNVIYSMPSLLARSHMGQGIFHRCSSLYHASVLDTYMEYINDGCIAPLKKEDISLRPFVTSDDLVIIAIPSPFRSERVSAEDIVEYLRSSLSKIGSFFMYLSIKTSDYKNILSENYAEFNSFYFGNEGFGSNDLKFINSLAEAGTSGNFLRDFQGCFHSYDSSINSGCTREVADAIFYSNYMIRCRQWKINPLKVGFPKKSDLIYGLPGITQQDENKLEWLYFPTKNNFRTKNKIKNLEPYDSYNILTRATILANLESIISSSGREHYKNMLVRFKENEKIIAPLNEYLRIMGVTMLTYQAFLKEMIEDRSLVSILSLEVNQPHIIQTVDYKTRRIEKFGTVNLKRSYTQELDPLTFALSTLMYEPWLTSGFSSESFISHIYRHSSRYNIKDIPDGLIDKTSFESAYLTSRKALDDFSISGGSVTQIISVREMRDVDYMQVVNIPVGIPYKLSMFENIIYGIPSSPITNFCYYVGSSNEQIYDITVDVNNMIFKRTDRANLAPSVTPHISKLDYNLSVIDMKGLYVDNLSRYALIEYLVQEKKDLTVLMSGQPICCFLNYKVNEDGSFHDEIVATENETMNLDLRMFGRIEDSSQLSTQIEETKLKRLTKNKISVTDQALDEISGKIDMIDDRKRRAILDAFNLTESILTDKQSDPSLLRYPNDEEEEDSSFYAEILRLGSVGKKKQKILNKSVAVDWRYVVLSNSFTFKRIIFVNLILELLKNNVIIGKAEEVYNLKNLEHRILHFDQSLPRKVGEILNQSFSNGMINSRKKSRLLKLISENAFILSPEDLVCQSSHLTISGKPKHLVVSRIEFNKDYTDGRIIS